MENCVRSAIAPETMVAVVAANTVWNIRKVSAGIVASALMRQMPSSPNTFPRKKKAPKSKPWNISPKPIIQKRIVPAMKSQKFFMRILAVFLLRVSPASTSAKPGCIKKTNIAASNVQTVSNEESIFFKDKG